MKTSILLTRLVGTAARIGLLTSGTMLALAFSAPVSSAASVKEKFTYVDDHGRMRNPKGEEVRYTGQTIPCRLHMRTVRSMRLVLTTKRL